MKTIDEKLRKMATAIETPMADCMAEIQKATADVHALKGSMHYLEQHADHTYSQLRMRVAVSQTPEPESIFDTFAQGAS